MVERAQEERSNADSRNHGSGCPVQNNQTESQGTTSTAVPTPPTGASSGRVENVASSPTGNRGTWSRIVSWVPFRGGGGVKATDNNSSNSSATTTAGSGAAAAVGAQHAASGNDVNAAISNRTGMGRGGGGGGGCPVQHENNDGGEASSSGCPVQHDSASAAGGEGLAGFTAGGGGQRGDGGGRGGEGRSGSDTPEYNARNNEYVYGQDLVPGQEMPLSTARQRSTIPKADFNPPHQPKVSPLSILATTLVI